MPARPATARRPAKRVQPLRTRVAKKAAPAPAPAAPPAGKAKADKPAKVKLVRDSFTIPKAEYEALEALKKRASRADLPSKKSEVLRAGLMALAAMEDAAFRAAMGTVPKLKTGRPKKA